MEDSEEKPFKCFYCGFSTSLMSLLTLHLTTHPHDVINKAYDYKIIQAALLSQILNISSTDGNNKTQNLLSEAENNTQKTNEIQDNLSGFKCEFCEYWTPQKPNLDRHLRTHTGEKPFKCDSCNYRASLKSLLEQHLTVHTGERRFICSDCGYRAARKSSLNRHLNIHAGRKPYKCKLCEYRTSQSSNLKQHMRVHTGEKPYKCSFCDYKATQMSSLKRHLGRHIGETPVFQNSTYHLSQPIQ